MTALRHMLKPLPLLGLLILLAGSAMTLANAALREADNGKSVWDGGWAAQFGKDFDEALALRKPSLAFWTTAGWRLFGEARSGAVVGAQNWLFTSEEFDGPEPARGIEATLAFARAMKQKLDARGVDLVVALVPAKARIYPDKLNGTVWPSQLKPVYGELRARLAAAGIATVDLETALKQGRARGQMFLSTDTHWSPDGTRVAAYAIAAQLARSHPELVPGNSDFSLTEVRTDWHQGDLLTYLPLGDYARAGDPRGDRLTLRDAVGDSGGGLFGDADTPIMLVGTSYSANSKWGFEAELKAATRSDIVNAASEGKGPFVPLREAVEGTALDEAGTKLIVWELPERYVWMKGELGPPNGAR